MATDPAICASPEVIFCEESSSNGERSELDYIRRQIVRAVMRRDQDRTLYSHTRGLIKNYTRKRGETAEQFFRNHSEYFYEYLAQQMLDNLFAGPRRSSKGPLDEPVPKSPRFDLFESWMEKLTRLFGFYEAENAHHSIKTLVEEVAQHLVPVFIISRKRHKEIAQSLVDQISEITRWDRRMLIYKYWDGIFERWVLTKIRDSGNTADIDTYLYHWIQNNRVDYFVKKTLRSMFRALLCLCLNEKFVLSLVEDIHRHSSIADHGVDSTTPFSLSTAIRRSFTKIVFDFRDAITANHVERPKIAIRSLAVLMDYLDGDLINENGQNLLITMKAATTCTGELCVPAWIKFISKLSRETFLNLVQQIIIAIAPLLKYDSSKLLLHELLVNRNGELSNCKKAHLRVNQTLLTMLDNNPLKLERRLPPEWACKLSNEPHSVVINSCAELLTTGTVDSYQIILARVLRVLDSSTCDLLQIDASRLARALICSLQKIFSPELKCMIGKCLGSIGLLDLDGTSSSRDRTEIEETGNTPTISVDDRVQFCIDFIKGILHRIGECEPSGVVAQIHHCLFYIMTVVLKNEGLDAEVWERLPKEMVATLNTIRDSSLRAVSRDGPDLSKVDDIFEQNTVQQSPLIDYSDNFDVWIRYLFYSGTNKLNDQLLRHLFATLVYINHTAIVSKIMCSFYPHLIVQSVIEGNEQIISEFEQEVISVFNAAINDRICWTNEAAHSIFCILDHLERIAIGRAQKDTFKAKDKVGIRLNQLIVSILGNADPNSGVVPRSVLVARKCNYHFRAMRWLEQLAPPRDKFHREFYFVLEQLYDHLENSDGVLGTFQLIRDQAIPEPREHILALKVEGNFVDVLPFCQNLPGQEQEMIKCLLRSNQPLLAQSYIEHMLRQKQAEVEMAETEDERSVDKNVINKLREYQMEATCKLGDWDQLATLRTELEHNTTVNEQLGQEEEESWGAQIASIFCDLKQFDQQKFGENVKKARLALANSLRTITLEGSRTISQTHRNLIKLRSLYEMERVMGVLYSGGDKSLLIRKIINEWEHQQENSLSFVGQSESVISLRRGLLRAIDLPNTAQTQCRLLLQCSTLARNAKHLQRSWTYIAEAKALNGQKGNIAIDMEESNYLFQKGEQFQAISLLEKSIDANFHELCAELKNGTKSLRIRDSNSTTPISDNMSGTFKTRRCSFIEAQLLLADFNERAGAKQMEALLQTYDQLETFGELSECFYYRYAMFYDGYCESAKEIGSEMICNLLRLYRSVLEYGPRYINHAIPRMLTIWLDLSPKCSLSEVYGAVASIRQSPSSGSKKSRRVAQQQQQEERHSMPHSINDPNKVMKQAFERIDKAYFFTSFAQMISRITHSDPAAYALLKEILSDLIVQFPHQSMWLSLQLMRSSRVRAKRCTELLELAKKKAQARHGTDLNVLIGQYDYLAAALLKVAESPVGQKSGLVFDRFFPFVVDFFNSGKMRADILGLGQRSLGRNSEMSTTRPQLLLPFVDGIPSSNADFDKFPQASLHKEVFIRGVDTHFDCLKSLESPKKLWFIGSDGRKYPLLCKSGDDLCKDARFMDVNRMLNTLFARDSETKNQLYIRCYSVIPLKECGGGIIQWVPNLVTFAQSLKAIMQETNPLMGVQELHRLLGDNANLTSQQRVKVFRHQVCPRFPLSMAHWLRRNFLDACSWYNARLAFTRTAATMSMVGFLLGLGDRHGENILLDTKTGDLIHVDFNILFDKGETLKVPELVPFRLTRNMIDGFGATGVEGTFRKSCEKALKIMRTEKRMLGTVLQAFAHDPLVEWTTTEARNQQHRQYGGTTLQSQQDNATDTIDKIKMRLAGHIVTSRLHPPKTCAVPMSVEGQVAKLIEIAKDEGNLSKMYVGWSAMI